MSSAARRFTKNYSSRKVNRSTKKLSSDIYTQDLVQVKDIVDGLIFLENGSIIQILEMLPINFNGVTDTGKDLLSDTLAFNFKQLPHNGHMKSMCCATNIDAFIDHVRVCCRDEKDPAFMERVEDYIQNSMRLKTDNSICRRFLYIHEYEGGIDGKVTDNYDEIRTAMLQQRVSIANTYAAMGNIVLTYENNPMGLAEILYQYFNPNSSDTDSFEHRYQKVQDSVSYVKAETGNQSLAASIKDMVAPRGFRLGKWNYLVVDGMYHAFLCLRDNAYPSYAEIGWLDTFYYGAFDCDIDIHYRMQPRDTSLYFLDRGDVFGRALALRSSSDKEEQHLNNAHNAKYIKDRMEKLNEELYNVVVIATVKAKSFKELMFKKNMFIKQLKIYDLAFDESFLNTLELYQATMPYMNLDDDIYKAHKRNMTNDSLATLYNMTSFEIFSPTGYALGLVHGSGTMLALDNFNTTMFENPHITILGTSGSGKTYTEQMLTSRMRMQGVRVIYVLPLKGHEYKNTVRSFGGTYIILCPGSKICINIMDIRPEDTVADDGIDEDFKLSLLSQKITRIIAWIGLLLNSSKDKLRIDEIGELSECITKVYSKFGITDDNDSIWANKNKKQLKIMPILEDLYNEVSLNERLTRIASVLKPWVFGQCKNMNGQTNIDLSNRMIAFDINEDVIGEELLPAFMYIAFDIAYSIAKKDSKEKCALVLDETWKMLVVEDSAKQIHKMIKILRSYMTCVITATQDIADCLRNEYGRALLSNSAIRIFHKVKDTEADNLASVFTSITPKLKEQLQSLQRGNAFIFFNKEKVKVSLASSDLEQFIYTTEPQIREALRPKITALWPNVAPLIA